MERRILRHQRFVKSIVDQNSNKAWYITEYDNATVKTEWGRIRETTSFQSKEFSFSNQSATSAYYDKKVKEKLKGSSKETPYVELPVVNISDSNGSYVINSTHSVKDTIISQMGGSDIVNEVLTYLYDMNIHSIVSNTTLTYNIRSGLFSTPLGIVARNNVIQARQYLKNMLDLLRQSNRTSSDIISSKEYVAFIEKYLMLIPQSIKDMRKVMYAFSTISMIQEQNSILDSLDSSLDMIEKQTVMVNVCDSKIMTKLDDCDDSYEIQRIKKIFESTKVKEHHYDHICCQKLYQIQTDDNAYLDLMKNEKSNEFYHGSRSENILSILYSGYMPVPPHTAAITGKMFGIGGEKRDSIYLSDQSSKSLQYSLKSSSDKRSFLIINDVYRGRILFPKSKQEAIDIDRLKYDSIYVKGGTCGIYNNEAIVPVSRIRMKYLCECY